MRSSAATRRASSSDRRGRSLRAIKGLSTQHPAPHRFVRDVEPTLSKEILHVPVAQRKAWVENARLTSLFSLSKEQAV